MQTKNRYSFYIIRYSDGTYWKGYTNNLKMRLKSYSRPRFAKSKLPIKLIYAGRPKYRCIPDLADTYKSVMTKLRLGNINYKLYDYKSSKMLLCGIQNQLKDDIYEIKRIHFDKNDVVIDIGGHVGFVSIYLAKNYPFIKIFAFEPIPDNYLHFKENIKLNKATNIKLFNRAVTKDGRDIEMFMDLLDTGSATAKSKETQLTRCNYYVVKSLTLDDIFKKYHIKKCKLLKIDCEGSEYEILMHSKQLRRIEYLSGEFHYNRHLRGHGFSPRRLFDYCGRFIRVENISYHTIKMPN